MAISEIFVTISASFDELAAAFLKASNAINALGRLLRERTMSGSIVFWIAVFLGFDPLAVVGWLESCPGAFADEFGDGWHRDS